MAVPLPGWLSNCFREDLQRLWQLHHIIPVNLLRTNRSLNSTRQRGQLFHACVFEFSMAICNLACTMSYYDVHYVPTRHSVLPMIPKALVAASIKPFVLSILHENDNYGYAIIQRVKLLTSGQIEWTTSTLYPVLHSLENKGFLESQWQTSQEGPRRKYYRLTPKGRKALEREKKQWLDVHQALMQLWNPPGSFPGSLEPA